MQFDPGWYYFVNLLPFKFLATSAELGFTAEFEIQTYLTVNYVVEKILEFSREHLLFLCYKVILVGMYKLCLYSDETCASPKQASRLPTRVGNCLYYCQYRACMLFVIFNSSMVLSIIYYHRKYTFGFCIQTISPSKYPLYTRRWYSIMKNVFEDISNSDNPIHSESCLHFCYAIPGGNVVSI